VKSPRTEIILNLDHHKKKKLFSAAIRKKKFKFIWGQDKLLKRQNTEKSGSVELYNLEKDPYERKNIALRLPRFVSRLKLRLIREYSEMRAARYSKQCKQGWPSQFGGVLTTGWCQPVV